jgi:hypothetical protein
MKKFFLPLFLILFSLNGMAYYSPARVKCNFAVNEISKGDSFPASASSFSGSLELEKKGSLFVKSWQGTDVEIEVTVEYLDQMYTSLMFRRNGKTVFQSMTETRADEYGAFSSTINGYGNYVSDILRSNEVSVSEAIKRDLFEKGRHFVSIYLKCF